MARLLLIACLAASAGVHLTLATVHGLSFHVAALLLAGLATALALRPSRLAAAGAGLLLSGLLASYLVENGAAFDAVAAATKGVEALGLAAAVKLALADPAHRPRRLATFALGALVAVSAATATPAVQHEHDSDTPPHGHASVSHP